MQYVTQEYMTKGEVKKRIEELREVINHHRYLYHVLDEIEISDAALDSLKNELKQLEDAYPELIAKDSPTQRVGGVALEKFEKVRHKVKQWSLEDAFSENEIRGWYNRIKRFLGYEHAIEMVGELKIDGLHIVLTYQNGILITGATRGDGEIGEDVTQNLKTIEAIPLRLQKNIDCVVEGEVFMRKSVFEKLNEKFRREGKPLLANPRNAAAGAIRQLDSKIAAERNLDAFLYELAWPEDRIPKTQKEELEYLSTLGCKVNKHWRRLRTIEDAIAFWKEWEYKKDREDYWIDGIVLKANERDLQGKLGYTGKAPRFMLAAKFLPEEQTTIIKKIIPSVGRTGKITPVALLKPVEIKGTIVSRATLHNYDEISRLDAREGDTVIITKAGDVIPKVTSVIKELRRKGAKALAMPTVCPICEKPVMREEGEVDIFCENPLCGAMRAKKLIHFASKQGLDIEGLGKKIVSRLMDEGYITDIVSIFDLTKNVIKDLEGFGEKSADNLLYAIKEAKRPRLEKFFNALGIEYVGSETAKWIAQRLFEKFGAIRNPKELLAIWQKLSPEDIKTIEGIGPKVCQSFTVFIKEKQNRRLLEELAKRGMKFSEGSVFEGKFNEKIFLFTGGLSSMSRGEAQKKVIDEGGGVAESISKRVDYLVVGVNPGSKLAKAKRLGIKTLSENEFLTIFQKPV